MHTHTFEVIFRDGHTEVIRAATGVGAQFASSDWTEVTSVRPIVVAA